MAWHRQTNNQLPSLTASAIGARTPGHSTARHSSSFPNRPMPMRSPHRESKVGAERTRPVASRFSRLLWMTMLQYDPDGMMRLQGWLLGSSVDLSLTPRRTLQQCRSRVDRATLPHIWGDNNVASVQFPTDEAASSGGRLALKFFLVRKQGWGGVALRTTHRTHLGDIVPQDTACRLHLSCRNLPCIASSV